MGGFLVSTSMTAQLLLLLLSLLTATASDSEDTEHCLSHGSFYFDCINDCGCGMCDRRCLPATQSGRPASGYSCADDESWTTNTPSLICAIHDRRIAPILTALLSTIVAAGCVVLMIALLLFIHYGCSYIIERRQIDEIEVVMQSDFVHGEL